MTNLEEFISHSPEETRSFAKKLGQSAKPGSFFALLGPMGAGKTTFTQGFVEGVGFSGEAVSVTSPSYALIHELPTRIPIFHLDLYRLSSVEEIEEIGYRDLLAGDSIVVVEWAEKILDEIPRNCTKVQFSSILEPGNKSYKRKITISSK